MEIKSQFSSCQTSWYNVCLSCSKSLKKNEKVKIDDGELFGDNVLIKELGKNTVDIYTRFEENKKQKSVTMRVAFDLGGIYLSSHNDADKYAAAEKLLKDFAVKTSRAPLEEKSKAALKLLGEMEGTKKDLEKENEKLHNEVDDYKSKISKAQDDIRKNEETQAKKRDEMDAQKALIEQLRKETEGVR